MDLLEQFKQSHFEHFVFKRDDAVAFMATLPAVLKLDLYFRQPWEPVGSSRASINFVADEDVFRVLAFSLIYSALSGAQEQLVFETADPETGVLILKDDKCINGLKLKHYRVNELVYTFERPRPREDEELAIDLYKKPIFYFALDSQPPVDMGAKAPLPSTWKNFALITGSPDARINLAHYLLDFTHPSSPFSGFFGATRIDFGVSVGSGSVNGNFVLKKYMEADPLEFDWVID